MTDFHRILKTLADANVDFIVVGGVAAVLQGAPIHTKDLDILYSLETANQVRLLGALQQLGAVFRDDPRRMEPNLSHLASRGHKLLTTSAGKLDCLGHYCSTCTAKTKPPTHRSGYRPWRELLMRTFKIDVELCHNCGGRLAAVFEYARVGDTKTPVAGRAARPSLWIQRNLEDARLNSGFGRLAALLPSAPA